MRKGRSLATQWRHSWEGCGSRRRTGRTDPRRLFGFRRARRDPNADGGARDADRHMRRARRWPAGARAMRRRHPDHGVPLRGPHRLSASAGTVDAGEHDGDHGWDLGAPDPGGRCRLDAGRPSGGQRYHRLPHVRLRGERPVHRCLCARRGDCIGRHHSHDGGGARAARQLRAPELLRQRRAARARRRRAGHGRAFLHRPDARRRGRAVAADGEHRFDGDDGVADSREHPDADPGHCVL